MLPACLESLGDVCDELVVLDTGSTDRTLEILAEAAKSGLFSQVSVQTSHITGFGAMRTVAKQHVQTPWILWIDADERLSEKLRNEIKSLMTSETLNRYDGYLVPFLNFVLNRPMLCRELNHEKRLRLYKADVFRFSNDTVHESLLSDTEITLGQLEHRIHHHTMYSWKAYLEKVSRYTSLEARQTDRKFNPLHWLVTAPATFLQQYLRRTCIRDGWPGFVWAVTSAWSSWLRDWKLMIRDWFGGSP